LLPKRELPKWKAGFAHFLRATSQMESQFLPTFVVFCPLPKRETGLKKPSIYAGLRVFCPLSHFFLLINMNKKIIKIYKVAKKSGLLTKAIFLAIGGDILTKAQWCRKFSEKVQKLMGYRGFSQRELARIAKIPENTLSRYLSGQRIPRADQIVNIAKALDCTVSELIQFGEMVTK